MSYDPLTPPPTFRSILTGSKNDVYTNCYSESSKFGSGQSNGLKPMSKLYNASSLENSTTLTGLRLNPNYALEISNL